MNWRRRNPVVHSGLSVESRDPYTEGHCERLARHASDLGRHLALTRMLSLPCATAGVCTIVGEARARRN